MHCCSPHQSTPALRSNAGFTLIETLFALGLAGSTLAGVLMLNSHLLRLVKSTQSTNAASLCLQERVEQVRSATWEQVTSPSFLTTSYFASAPRSAAPLADFFEVITISAYPDPTVTPKLIARKKRGATAELVRNGTDIAKQEMARVDIEMNWTGDNGRARTRQFVTIISNGGISRSNLPAMGSVAGKWPATTSTPAQTTATSTPVSATLPPAILPPPSKNQRGSTGGKTGKK